MISRREKTIRGTTPLASADQRIRADLTRNMGTKVHVTISVFPFVDFASERSAHRDGKHPSSVTNQEISLHHVRFAENIRVREARAWLRDIA